MQDFLSQAALLRPPPLDTAEFRREWEGLSLFDSPDPLRKLGKARRWRLGEFIAELDLPDDAPFTFSGPARKGHWLLYDADGTMLVDESAARLLGYVVRVIHGPSEAT